MCAKPIKNNANLFSIDDPDKYICSVAGFYPGHRILEVKMLHPEKSNYLLVTFNFVSYFSGPTSWQGANFKIAPIEQFMKINKSLHHINETPDKEMLKDIMQIWHLYTVNDLKTNIQVQIFACQTRLEIKENSRE